MDDDDDEYEGPPSFPWTWKGTLVHCGQFAADVLESGSTLVRDLTYCLAASVNHDIDQVKIRREMELDIESITKHTEE